jgi:hypothetical protein
MQQLERPNSTTLENAMSRFAFLACAVLVVACATNETPTTDSSAAAAMAAPAVSVADFAGTWSARAMPERGDSTLITFDLMATADTTPWMMHFANGEMATGRILSVAGDSIVTEFGPYTSALRPGVQVTTTTTSRLQDGRLVGTFVARYNVTTADSVLRGRVEGTRKP